MEEYIAGRQLVVRPEIAPAALCLLETERASYEGDPSAPEYLDSIRGLIAAVNENAPIDLNAYMARTRDLDAGETVGRYLTGTIKYGLHRRTSEVAAVEDWHYLSDVAALGADVEAAKLAQV
jgi:hypothetical protein